MTAQWLKALVLLLLTPLFGFICLQLLATPPDPSPVYPVILVPGDGGCQIEARLNRTQVAHWWCKKTSDWWVHLCCICIFVLGMTCG